MKLRYNDLYDYNLKIIQAAENFKFSLDSILLAEYVKVKKTDKIIDLCTGNAPIPLILSTKFSNKIIGIELQKNIFKQGKKSIYYNKLNDQIFLINDDVNNLQNYFPGNNFDVITCNPPYFKFTASCLINHNKEKAISRHEIYLTLEQLINQVKYLLTAKGSFYLVYRVERLQEIFILSAKLGLKVKELVFIKTADCDIIETVLINIKKNANYGLKTKVVDVRNLKSYKNIFRREK